MSRQKLTGSLSTNLYKSYSRPSQIEPPQHGQMTPIMQIIIVPEMMEKLAQFEATSDDDASNVEVLQGLQKLFDQLVTRDKPLTILEKAQVNHLLELSDKVSIDKLLSLLNRDGILSSNRIFCFIFSTIRTRTRKLP